MEEIISIYILKAIKTDEFNKNGRIYWVLNEYFDSLVKIFDTDNNHKIKILLIPRYFTKVLKESLQVKYLTKLFYNKFDINCKYLIFR